MQRHVFIRTLGLTLFSAPSHKFKSQKSTPPQVKICPIPRGQERDGGSQSCRPAPDGFGG
jgi:hypothetical protein